jgi:hypothetical protein
LPPSRQLAACVLAERQEIPDHYRCQDPKKYKGNNDDSNDYRSEGFHFVPIVIMFIERSVIDGTGHDDRRGRHQDLGGLPSDGERRAVARWSGDCRPCGGVVPHVHAASVGAILVSRHRIIV